MFYSLAVLRAELLLAVGGPIELAADRAGALTVEMVPTLGFTPLLSLGLFDSLPAVFGAENLPIAFWDVLFAAVGADFFLYDLAAVFGDLLRLAFFPVGFGACFLLAMRSAWARSSCSFICASSSSV